MCEYKALFQPLKVGNIMLRNRIVAAPITKYGLLPSMADELETIAAKARGGAGMVIVGSVAVEDQESLIYHEASSLNGSRKGIYNEEISLIHQYGAKAEVQLLHCGMFADMRHRDGNPVGPYTFVRDEIPFQGYEGVENNQIMDGRTVIGIGEAKMKQICDQYAGMAVEAKRMGFDVVMLHFAHGWLPAQFLSPFFNKRTDGYGGCFENRIRFPMMIVDAVRKAVGPGYTLDMRIGAKEYVEGGLEPDEVIEFLRRIEDKIDMVHISSGLDKFIGPTSYIETPSIQPHGINVEFARKAKEILHIPVCTVGGITMPGEAEKILENGWADMVALGRGLIADPDWPEKARRGCNEDITPCIRCVSCYGVATEGRSQGCAVNPRYTRQLRLQTEESGGTVSCHVAVVGGGPAGMRAAVSAAERGHQVTLYEEKEVLGGLLAISDEDDTKIDMRNYKNHLIAQVMKSDRIEVKLNTKASPEMIRESGAERLIVATGSVPVRPPVKGIDKPHVYDIVSAHYNEDKMGDTTAIIGGGPSGCELALALGKKGKKLILIEMTDKLAAAGNVLYRGALEELLKGNRQIDVKLGTRAVEIRENTIVLKGPDGIEYEVPADNVVYCTGLRPRQAEAESFMEVMYDVRLAGDCIGPRRINEAVHEGYFAGRFIV